MILSHDGEDSGLQRELTIRRKKSLEPIKVFLNNRRELELSEHKEASLVCDGELVTRIYPQGNAKASRRQSSSLLREEASALCYNLLSKRNSLCRRRLIITISSKKILYKSSLFAATQGVDCPVQIRTQVSS